MVAIAAVVSAIAAVLVVLFGDSGLLGLGGASTQPAQAQPPAATGAPPPGSADRATPQQEAPGDPFTEAERRLARRAEQNENEREGAIRCNSASAEEKIDGAVATLRCHPVRAHWPIEVTVASFPDASALDEFISSIPGIETASIPEPLDANGAFSCPDHNTWGSSVIVGPYACRTDGSEYVAVWGFTNDAYNSAHGGEVFAVLAASGDRLALGDWWGEVPV